MSGLFNIDAGVPVDVDVVVAVGVDKEYVNILRWILM